MAKTAGLNVAAAFRTSSMIRLSSRLCSAGLIGSMGIPSTVTALGLFFFGMSVLRHSALDARSRCRRTIYFARGVDSFGFFGCFLRALAPGKKLHQRRFPFQFALALDTAHQATDLRSTGKSATENRIEFRDAARLELHGDAVLKCRWETPAFQTEELVLNRPTQFSQRFYRENWLGRKDSNLHRPH
jgi:hypothetical protein